MGLGGLKNSRQSTSTSLVQKKGSRTAGPVSPIKKRQTLADLYKQQALKGKNKHVELIGKNISDLNAKELGASIKAFPVKSLDLSGNSLTDEGLKIICRALCESGIEKVNLTKNKIGEKHIDQILQVLKTSKSSLR